MTFALAACASPQNSTPVAGYRFASPHVMMEPLPTGAVLLTRGRADANQDFCIEFFAITPSATRAISENKNVVQIFWPTLKDPGAPQAGRSAVADWCKQLLNESYDYQRAALYLNAIGHATSKGPVLVLMSNGDLRHPDFILDAEMAPAEKVGAFAKAIAASVAAVSAKSNARDQAIEQGALQAAASSQAKQKPLCSWTTEVTRSNGSLHITSDVPADCAIPDDAATKGIPPPGAAVATDRVERWLDLASAETNPSVRRVCDIAGDILPLVEDLGPVVAVTGDIVNWSICKDGLLKEYEHIKKWHQKPAAWRTDETEKRGVYDHV